MEMHITPISEYYIPNYTPPTKGSTGFSPEYIANKARKKRMQRRMQKAGRKARRRHK